MDYVLEIEQRLFNRWQTTTKHYILCINFLDKICDIEINANFRKILYKLVQNKLLVQHNNGIIYLLQIVAAGEWIEAMML